MRVFFRVSVKRRRAPQECDSLSNSRKARLHTAAEVGGAQVPPTLTLASRLLPVVGASWLRKLPQAVRPKAEAAEDGPEGAGLQACLIACNPRQFDEVAHTERDHSMPRGTTRNAIRPTVAVAHDRQIGG
jgi:hypothetical protein